MKALYPLLFSLMLFSHSLFGQGLYQEWNVRSVSRPQFCDTFGCVLYTGNIVCDEVGNSYTYVRENSTSSILKMNTHGLIDWRVDSVPDSNFPSELDGLSYHKGYLYYLSYSGLRKYDLDGYLIWECLFEFESWSDRTLVHFDSEDNILINWQKRFALSGFPPQKIYITKINHTGVLDWTHLYDVRDGLSYTSDLALDKSDNIYLSYSSLDDRTNGDNWCTNFLRKIGPNGDTLWCYRHIGMKCDNSFSLDVRPTGDIWANLNYNMGKDSVFVFDQNGALVNQFGLATAYYTNKENVNDSYYFIKADLSGYNFKAIRSDLDYNQLNSFQFINEYLITSMYNSGNYYVFTIPGDSQTQIKIYKLDSSLKLINTLIHTYENPAPPGYGGIFTYAAIDSLEDIHMLSNNWGWSCEFYKICQSCKPNITGNVYYDENQNCIRDQNEIGIPNRLIMIAPVPAYTFTDSIGNFGFIKAPGQYTISQQLPLYWQDNCNPVAIAILDTINNLSAVDTFSNYCRIGVHDKAVSMIAGPARPGAEQVLYINYKNFGTTADEGYVAACFDPAFQIDILDPPSDSSSGNTYFWLFNNLKLGEQRQIGIGLNIPVSTALSQPYQHTVLVGNVDADDNIADNFDTVSAVVVGSYDPNEKYVATTNLNPLGYLTDSSTLNYEIHFQNTGTDTAFKVVVVDTLDSDLDMTTFKMIQTTAKYDIAFLESQAIKWTFDNILLPDSGTNMLKSMGFIKYSIRPKNGLLKGTSIRNSASIYFDFNSPVKTNTTVNYYELNLAIKEVGQTINKAYVVPNPVNTEGRLYLQQPTGKTTNAILYDYTGKIVANKEFEDDSNMVLPVGNLASGIYLVELKQDNLRYSTCKFVITK